MYLPSDPPTPMPSNSDDFVLIEAREGGNSPSLDISSDCIQYSEAPQLPQVAADDGKALTDFLRRRTRLLWGAYDAAAKDIRGRFREAALAMAEFDKAAPNMDINTRIELASKLAAGLGERAKILGTLAKVARDLAAVDRSGNQNQSNSFVNRGVIVLPGKDAPEAWSGRAQANGREGAPGRVDAVDLDQVQAQLDAAAQGRTPTAEAMPKAKRKVGRPRTRGTPVRKRQSA